MDLPEQFLKEMKRIVPDYEGFLRSYAQPPTRAFRVNEVKISDQKLLEAMGGAYVPVRFAEHCYRITDEKWGNHPFHHAGLMYFQEPSAMATVSAYDIDAHLALDMCAAPGGKTVMLAQKCDHVVANEIIPSRAAVLKSNVERLGLKNVAVTNCSPKELEAFGEVFDLVLVDAPCSGEGMFRKDEVAVREWSVEHSLSCATRQQAILSSADKVLKKGGMLIYSTCTFSECENEGVINAFLNNFDYELVSPKQSILNETTFLRDERMRRFYPHLGEGEGQFFAALVKKSGGERQLKAVKYCRDKSVSSFLVSAMGHDLDYIKAGDIFCCPALPYELKTNKIVSGGVKLGRNEKIFKPDHNFFSALGGELFCYEASMENLKKYLHGEELEGDHEGYLTVTVLGAPLGGLKGSNGRYKNLYPKGLRI